MEWMINMKVSIFKSDANTNMIVQDSTNPTNFYIEIDSNYVKYARKHIPKKYHQDIEDNYIVIAVITKKQKDKLNFLSTLDWIRDGSGFKYP